MKLVVCGICGICGTVGRAGSARCPSCGFDGLLKIAGGAVVSFPAGSFPCPGCGSDRKPLVFRAWVRHLAYVLASRESRLAGYVCLDCARRRTAAALVYTGLLGWWGVLSFLFRAPRATFYNWLAAFRHPISPLAWGAIPVDQVIAEIRARREATDFEAFNDVVVGSPLADLTESELELVIAAPDLYAVLRVSPSASTAELRRAYAARAKEAHPDRRPGEANAVDEMIELNHAWAVLRDEKLRRAYDWLQAHRAEAFS